MAVSVDIAFAYLPAIEFDRLPPGQIECEIVAFQRRCRCLLVTSKLMLGGERQRATLLFDRELPSWMRKGLTVRLWRDNATFGAAIIQSVPISPPFPLP